MQNSVNERIAKLGNEIAQIREVSYLYSQGRYRLPAQHQIKNVGVRDYGKS
jgi:hypothetical protein